MTFANKLKDIMKVNLKEDEVIPPTNDNSKFAIEAFSDFEGNSIPQRYRPVYIMKFGDSDYDFTKRLIPGRSLFNKSEEQAIIEDLKQKENIAY